MNAQLILCVPRTLLEERLGTIPLGFTTHPDTLTAFQRTVQNHGEFRPRPELEEDPEYLQVIVQGIVTNGDGVLALFRRSREQGADRFVETRHNAKVALSVGGHVEPVEARADDVLRSALHRELLEEILCDPPVDILQVTPLGLVCNAAPDAPLFHRVHIGFVSLVPVSGTVRLPEGSDEFDHLEFTAPDRLRELLPRMEGWGQILATALLEGQLVLLKAAHHRIR